MALHEKTQRVIAAAHAILAALNPMTVRQVYYRLVAALLIENTRSSYQGVSRALVAARQDGTIPWAWIEDRLRRPRHVSMWKTLPDFLETVRHAYQRDVWQSQPQLVEVWLEKDALSGIFEDVLSPYGITLNVGRGYDGWSSLHEAARRYIAVGKPVTILYFGDFDPSGEDMVRSLRERLRFFDCTPEVIKCALTHEDVTTYNLPPDFTKASDSRAAAFVQKFGDMAVELDALPPDVLQARLVSAVEGNMDLKALKQTGTQEKKDRAMLASLLKTAK